MPQIRRWSFFPLMILIFASLLAACGSNTSSGSNGLTGTITYWYQQGSSPNGFQAIRQLEATFEKEHPGAHVTIVQVPKDDFNTKLATALATGTTPDASVVDQITVASLAQSKKIVSAPSGLVNAADFTPVPYQTNVVNGTLYGLPQGQTCIALFYNKDLVATPPTTWDQFTADARQVYNPAKKIAAVSFPTSGGYAGWMFPAFVAQAGGTMLDVANKKVTFADQPGAAALNLWKTLYSYSPSNIVNGQNSFATGHVAMLVSGPWEVSGFQNFPALHWGVTLLPKDTQYGTNLGGENGVVYAKSKHQPLAWEWLKYLSTEANVSLNDNVSQNFPVYKNGSSPTSQWAQEQPFRAIFLQQMAYSQARPEVDAWNKINDEVVGKAIENALLKGMDAQAALSAAASQAKIILGW